MSSADFTSLQSYYNNGHIIIFLDTVLNLVSHYDKYAKPVPFTISSLT